MRRSRGDDGSALVEFVALAVLLLVPLVHVVLAVASVQRTSYAASSAVREAARAYVTSDSPAQARTRAVAAARLALADHGVALPRRALHLTCLDGPCLSPGGRVSVSLRLVVALPGAPAVLEGAVPATIPVTATHVEVVDTFRGTS